MGKRICILFSLALFNLLLCACQAGFGEEITGAAQDSVEKIPEQVLEEQGKDDMHDAFLVSTGGTPGTLLITVEREEPLEADSGGFSATFSVWNPAMMENPIQTFKKHLLAFGYSYVVDANFDGVQDFGYMYMMGNQPNYWYFWLWNQGQGKFIECEALSEISGPLFNEEKQVVTGWQRGSAVSGVETYYRWLSGEPVLMRRIEFHYPTEEGTQLATVEDLIDGQMVEVYRKENVWAEMSEGDPRIDGRWSDLDYHGE